MAKTTNKAKGTMEESALRKKYKGFAGKANEIILPAENRIWLPSRCLPLNHQLGGGQPQGTILEIFGPESSGKSAIAQDFAYVTQYLEGQVLWGDAEMCFEHEWHQKMGIDTSLVEVFQDSTIELFSDWMKDMCRYYRSKLIHNEPILIVWDSLAAAKCESDFEVDQSGAKAEFGNRAKAIGNLLRLRNTMIKKYGINFIAINQLRDNIGASMFEDPNKTVGGAAMKYYASQRLSIFRGKRIEDSKKRPYGSVGYIHCKKNKVAPPQQRFETEVYFKKNSHGYLGFSRYKGLSEILLQERVIKKMGNSFEFNGKKIARGKDHLEEVIESDQEIRTKLLSKTNINTISKTETKLSSIGKNLYPVKSSKSKDDE